jgi:GAF domain-containing protein
MPFQPRPELIKSLQTIAEDLFEATSPGRVTIRLDATNDPDYPVLAEARAPGVSSITGGMSLGGYKPVDIHKTTTVTWLREKREPIIQRDARVEEPAIPELEKYYGVTSQMLTPLDYQGRFVGLVSVHNVEPRDWTDEDFAAIKDATARVERELESAAWFDL